MTGSNFLDAAAAELSALVDPLRNVIDDPRPPEQLVRLLFNAGWTLPGLASADLTSVTGELESAIDQIEALPAAIRTSNLIDIAESLQEIGDTITTMRGLVTPFETLLSTLLGGTAGLAVDLIEDIWQQLVVKWLARSQPTLYRVLRSVRIVAYVDISPLSTTDGIQVRAETSVLRFEPSGLTGLISDPIGSLSSIYVPNTISDSVDAQTTALMIGTGINSLVGGLGGELAMLTPWGALDELPVAERDAAGRTLSIDLRLPAPDASPFLPMLSLAAEFLSPQDTGLVGRSGPGVELSVEATSAINTTHRGLSFDIDLSALAGAVFIGPDEIVAEAGGDVGASLEVSRTSTEPIILGSASGTRIELGQPRLRAELIGAGEPDVEIELMIEDVVLAVAVGDGDSFVASILPTVDLLVEFDLGLVWSRLGGLRLSGSPDMTLQLAADENILGVLTLDVVQATVDVAADSLTIAMTIDGEFTLGPFTARVEGIGMLIVLELTGNGNLGFGNLSLLFQPPSGFEFEILIADTIVGGGFVRHDAAIGRYTGALGLEVLTVELGAIVVVDTQLPGNPDGWALFASLFLTFPSVPLGFGFFLSGVGGIVALNRTMDSLAIGAGLRDGAIDTMLFPDNVVEDADDIIAQLDSWFPLAEGNTVFGVAATITWGTPKTLIVGQLAVMLALPEIEIAVLGSISMALPDEDDPLLVLNLDTLGSYDSAEKTVLVMASMYDSTLLGTIDLSGDMALYSRSGTNPYFLLSVGGYHPEFKPPPGGLPAAVLDLNRMRAEVVISADVWYALEAYIAITSSTFQFGALASFEASVEFLGVRYSASGHVGFDVLLVFSPFKFVVGFSAAISVTAGSNDNEIVAATLDARLEGPKPWYATGSGRFKFLFIDVKFDITVGGNASIEAKPLHHVLDSVMEALDDIQSWAEEAFGTSPVTLAEPEPPAETDAAQTDPAPMLRIRPDADIRVTQTVAPLNRTMDVFGNFAVDGPDKLEVTGSGVTGLSVTTEASATDWFAPALYDTLSQTQKLSAPSYEEMDAGVIIGAGGVGSSSDVRSLTPDYEVRVVNDEFKKPISFERRPQISDGLFAGAAQVLDPTRVGVTQRSAALPEQFNYVEPLWTVADAASGKTNTAATTYRDVIRTIDAQSAQGDHGVAIAVPVHATRGRVARGPIEFDPGEFDPGEFIPGGHNPEEVEPGDGLPGRNRPRRGRTRDRDVPRRGNRRRKS